MNTNSQPEKKENAVEPKKHSFWSRFWVAAAFGKLGMNLGFIGTTIDVRTLLDDNQGGSAWEKLQRKIKTLEEVENKSWLTARAKVAKYTLITTGIGIAIGAGIGWVRGGRIDKASDILWHPWQSTKIIFGFAEPATQNGRENEQKPANTSSAQPQQILGVVAMAAPQLPSGPSSAVLGGTSLPDGMLKIPAVTAAPIMGLPS